MHTLGVLGTNSSSLSMTDGEVRAEYRNGDKCHHAAVERKSVSCGGRWRGGGEGRGRVGVRAEGGRERGEDTGREGGRERAEGGRG